MPVSKIPSILVVDDEPDNFDVVEALLNDEDYELYYSPSGQQALGQLDHYRPDVILLDIMMPDMDGIEVCRRLKQMPKWSAVPVIIVTALTSKEDLAACLAAGADDFISKPVSRIELQARMQSMLRIYRQYQALAALNQTLEQTVQQRTSELHQRIFQDSLTQLPSRAFLLQHLRACLQEADRPFALIYLGCDQFKLINGSLGHEIGDQLLVAIAQRLTSHLGAGNILARVGEDEFCFFLDHTPDQHAAQCFVEQVIQSFDQAFNVSGFEVYITVSIGLALSSSDYTESQEPLQDADTAMYQAKLQGKGCYKIFDHHMNQLFVERLTLENDLRRALDRQEFVNYYQPVVNLATQQIVGFEALIRWLHPDIGLIPPYKFIPCMEETGLIIPVGMLVLRLACQQLHQWHQSGFSRLTVSVNFSPRQFAYPHLISEIDQVLDETHIAPELLRLEITESAIMEDTRAAVGLINELRSRRMQLSIDDFGTGYSSLSYLNQLPIDSLKIDRTFIKDINTPEHKAEILRAIVSLGDALDLNLVAEGIETQEQQTYLQSLGVQYAQGYLFGKPMPPSQSTAILQTTL